MGQKLGAVPLLGGGAGSPCNTLRPGSRPTFVPSGILIHPAICLQQIWAENWGLRPRPFGEGELGPHVTHCGLDRGLPSYQVASLSIQPFGHNKHRPKIGGLCMCPFGEGGPGSPSNTMWPGPRFTTCMPSFILIRPTVWPQYTNVTDRTDSGTIA